MSLPELESVSKPRALLDRHEKESVWVLIALAIIGNLVNIFAPVSPIVRAGIAALVLVTLAAACPLVVRPLEDSRELRYR